jgi:hypothetical protein
MDAARYCREQARERACSGFCAGLRFNDNDLGLVQERIRVNAGCDGRER